MEERLIVYFEPDAPQGQFKKQRQGDAGYDLMAASDADLEPGESWLFSTGVRVHVPDGFAGIIKSRSGLAAKQSLEVGAGVVDSNYTGEVFVLLRNLGSETRHVHRGDRIAQMCVMKLYDEGVTVAASPEMLGSSERNGNSLGSSDGGSVRVLVIDPETRTVTAVGLKPGFKTGGLYELVDCNTLVELPVDVRGRRLAVVLDEDGFARSPFIWSLCEDADPVRTYIGRGVLCAKAPDGTVEDPGFTAEYVEGLVRWL